MSTAVLLCSNGCRAPVIGRGLCRPCGWIARRDGTLPKTWQRINGRGEIVVATETRATKPVLRCACGRPSRKGRCRSCFAALTRKGIVKCLQCGKPIDKPTSGHGSAYCGSPTCHRDHQRAAVDRFRGEAYLSPAQVLARLEALDAAENERADVKLDLRRKLLAGVGA